MDSDNILSILNYLGQNQDPNAAQPPANVLQAAAPQPSATPAPLAAPAPPTPPQDIAAAATAASPPAPKPRRSLLDTIGRISDVLATVGGASPLYQPTLDARSDRATALEDHARKVNMDQLDYATKQLALKAAGTTADDSERTRFANVMGAVNDQEDAANLPAMMQVAGLTDPRYAPFVKMVQANPGVAKTLESALGGGANDKLGHNVYFGTDKDGKTVAYQIGDDGNPHILDFSGAGVTPTTPVKVVNTGGSNVIVDQSGKPVKILPNTISPNTAATVAQSDKNNQRTTQTQLTIAAMPARAQAGKAAAAKGDPAQALAYLDNIQKGFADLHAMQALPGEGGALNQVESALGRSALGQKLGEQLGSPAAQKRLELIKNINSLQSEMIQSLPGSATRTKFEQEIQKARLPDPMKMDYNTAQTVIQQLRDQYQRALVGVAKEQAASPAGNSTGVPTLTPEQAAKLPSGARFRTTDGRILVRQ